MVEFLISIVWFITKWFVVIIVWVLSWAWPLIVSTILIGALVWWIKRSWRRKLTGRDKYRLVPQKPAFFTNQYGHLVRVDPNPEMQKSIRSYLRKNNLTQKDL